MEYMKHNKCKEKLKSFPKINLNKVQLIKLYSLGWLKANKQNGVIISREADIARKIKIRLLLNFITSRIVLQLPEQTFSLKSRLFVSTWQSKAAMKNFPTQ